MLKFTVAWQIAALPLAILANSISIVALMYSMRMGKKINAMTHKLTSLPCSLDVSE